MSVSAKLYGLTREFILSNATGYPIDWANDTIKVALLTSSYTPNQDTHQFFSDLTNEITGTGYTAGGLTLTGKSKSYTGATNIAAFLAADAAWASSTLTARYAAVYKSTGTAGTSALIGYVDFGADVSSSNGTFTVAWTGGVVFTDTVA